MKATRGTLAFALGLAVGRGAHFAGHAPGRFEVEAEGAGTFVRR